MIDTLPLRRRRQFQLFKELPKLRAYDEFPLTERGIDPQLHASFNDVDQPFYLVCAKDCVLVQMTGTGRVEFRDSSVRHLRTKPGSYVYVPAGAPHRIVVDGPGAWLRYKAEEAGLEAVEWTCRGCDAFLHRESFDTAETLSQDGWSNACNGFNDQAELRTCANCGAEHPRVDVSTFRWAAVAATLKAGDGKGDRAF